MVNSRKPGIHGKFMNTNNGIIEFYCRVIGANKKELLFYSNSSNLCTFFKSSYDTDSLLTLVFLPGDFFNGFLVFIVN